jgi:hypothetical protein
MLTLPAKLISIIMTFTKEVFGIATIAMIAELMELNIILDGKCITLIKQWL